MNIFRTTDYKTYDIDTIINRQVKNIKKKYITKKEIEEGNLISDTSLKSAIEKITTWHFIRFENALSLIEGQNSDLLKVVDLDKKMLLDIFNMNGLMKSLDKFLPSYEKQLFKNNFEFRRNLLFCSFLNIIKEGGPFSGSEFGLVFAKMFNFDYAIPMKYASYDSSFYNPRLKEFIDKYLELGGSKQIYWLPNYYSDEEKDRFCLEELETVIEIIKNYEMGLYGEKPIQKKLTAK